MPTLAIIIGILLDILGIAGFMASGSHAPTALIPAVLGTLLIILGIVAQRNPWLTNHAMNGAAALSALGLLGGGGRALTHAPTAANQLNSGQIDSMASPGAYGSPGAIDTLNQVGALAGTNHHLSFWLQTLMALLSLIFLISWLRSFVEARNNRAIGSTTYGSGSTTSSTQPYNKDRMP